MGTTVWQFWLRPGVRFHGGSALTADSVQAIAGAVLQTVSVDVGTGAWRFAGLHNCFA